MHGSGESVVIARQTGSQHGKMHTRMRALDMIGPRARNKEEVILPSFPHGLKPRQHAHIVCLGALLTGGYRRSLIAGGYR